MLPAEPQREVRWERMFPDELEAAFADCPVLYLTYGMCEPHGPHAVVGLDTLKAHAVACAAARASGGIVAPPSSWHIHDFGPTAWFGHFHIGNVSRSWLTAMPPWHFWKGVLYHVRAADVLGFEAALLLTGHWSAVADDFARFVKLVQPHVGTRLAGLGDWAASGVRPDHAGKLETSLLWAVEPACVDASRLPPEGHTGLDWAIGADAQSADRRFGERLLADAVTALGTLAAELRSDYERVRPEHALRSYAQVEALWNDVVRPELPGFASAAEGSEGEADVPGDSVWFANWRPGIDPP